MLATEMGSKVLVADLARECLYRFLASVLLSPYEEAWSRVLDSEGQRLALDAADLLRAESATDSDPLAPGERTIEHLDLTGLAGGLPPPLHPLRAPHDPTFRP